MLSRCCRSIAAPFARAARNGSALGNRTSRSYCRITLPTSSSLRVAVAPLRCIPQASVNHHLSFSTESFNVDDDSSAVIDTGPVRIYVGNLDFGVEKFELQKYFEDVGQVTDVHLPRDGQTGRMRGFGFVTFARRDDAMEAIAKFDQTEYYNRVLSVNESRPREFHGSKTPVPSGPFNLAGNAEVRLFVGNLPMNPIQEELEEKFTAHGHVTDCYIPVDRQSGQPRAFGFITMPAADAELACEKMNGAEFQGRILRVNEASPRRDKAAPQEDGFNRGSFGFDDSDSFRGSDGSW